MKFWHFLKVLRNSWNLQNLLESPPGTCMWNLKQFGEVSIFDRKCRQRRTLEKGWNFDISQSSPKFMKLTEFIGITSRNMHVQFEAVWRSFNFWQKNANSAGPKKKDEILTFLKVLWNSWNLQNLLESPPGTCMWNLKQFGEVSIFDRKMPTAPDLWIRMKSWHFLKVLRNSWNLENLLESPPGTCMWNLKQFGEVSIFDRKMPTAPDLRKGWNFDIFSKFSKIHETYRIYWNHLQEHACEIWSSLEKFQFLTEKCRQRPDLRKRMKFWHFSKFSEIHETYRIYWNHLQEHVCEIWSSLEKFQFLTESCQQCRTLKRMKFWGTVSNFLSKIETSPNCFKFHIHVPGGDSNKFCKFHEFRRTLRNVKISSFF